MSNAATMVTPYIHPGFVPIKKELKGVPVEIVGEIPEELNGVFLRNGANSLYPRPNPHMFDGSAMLHAIEIRDGQARYSNSLLRTPFTKYIEDIGENPYPGFGDLTSTDLGTVARIAEMRARIARGELRNFPRIEQVFSSTAVMFHDSHLYCLQETGLPFLLDVVPDVDGWLQIPGTGRLENFDGVLDAPFSAHPKTDYLTKQVHSIGQNVMTGETVHTVLTPGQKASNTVLDKVIPPALYSHDLILTDRWVIFADSSLRYVPDELPRTGSVARFSHDHKLRFGIIARDHAPGDVVRWFETGAPGHIWHIANGWEEDNQIHVYAPVFREYPATVPIHSPAEPHAEFVAWRLDLATGLVTEETVLSHNFYERPSMDMRRAGQKSRYAWLLDESGGVMGQGVLKYDMIDRKDAAYVSYSDLLGGEPVFVPRDASKLGDDDDGWICDLLANGEKSELLILDAKSMTECCRIKMPHRVPFGVHGLWLDRGEVNQLIAG